MSEKIISEHTGKSVVAGENAIVAVDYVFTHDASGPLVLSKLKELGFEKLAQPDRTIIFIDHAVPSPREETSNNQATLRNFAKEWGIQFSDAGNGICHQVMAERYASPGQIIVGTDSHTCMAGALGAFATGMGATDTAVAMALGKTWFRVPESFKITIDGKLPKGVYAKDIILHLIGILGADGATYKAIEFDGSTVRNMEVWERLTLSNMAVEAGAKVGLIHTDEHTQRYLATAGRGREFKVIESDDDAVYEKTIEVDAKQLRPMVALPHAVDNVKRLDEVGNTKIDLVFIGSCTNTRLEDLHIAAKILKGRRVNSHTRLIVTPASMKVYLDASRDGTLSTLTEAGAVITPAGCGMCFGALGGVPADGERVFSTSNRNFPGRMGNPKAFTYLGSPAVAAVTAVKGEISDPSEFL